MYNRYIRNNQGQYIRQRVAPEPEPAPLVWEEPIPTGETPPPQPIPCPPPRRQPLDYLKHLLPNNWDTGDLLVLIVALLLLLDRDENEDFLPILITTAAFLFLN